MQEHHPTHPRGRQTKQVVKIDEKATTKEQFLVAKIGVTVKLKRERERERRRERERQRDRDKGETKTK